MSPWAPKRPCTQPGCPALVDKGRCERHRKQQRRASDVARGKERQFYGTTRWRKYREWLLRRDPTCIECDRLATVVDHVIDRKKAPELTFAEENCQALCASCHNTKTGREHGFA